MTRRLHARNIESDGPDTIVLISCSDRWEAGVCTPQSTMMIRMSGLGCVPDIEDAGGRDLGCANPDPARHLF